MGLDKCMKEAQVVSDWNLALKIRMEELGLTKTMTQNQMNPQSETTGSKVQGKKRNKPKECRITEDRRNTKEGNTISEVD